MIQLGVYSELTIARQAPPGFYLEDDDKEEVLLPNKFITPEMEVGDKISVFVYTDSEDRLTATTQTPKIKLNEFAFLEVKDVSMHGAFLDWGLDKDLFVPFKNQANRMEVGKKYIVYLYEDLDSDRLVGASKYNSYLKKCSSELIEGDEVEILIAGSSDLGVNVIVNNAFAGLLYHNQIFKELEFGITTKAYVTKVREDGKLDLSLEKQGYTFTIDDNTQKVLDLLNENNGKLTLSDKSSPEEIKQVAEMSKKNFKKAIGALYKSKRIKIEDHYIELICD